MERKHLPVRQWSENKARCCCPRLRVALPTILSAFSLPLSRAHSWLAQEVSTARCCHASRCWPRRWWMVGTLKKAVKRKWASSSLTISCNCISHRGPWGDLGDGSSKWKSTVTGFWVPTAITIHILAVHCWPLLSLFIRDKVLWFQSLLFYSVLLLWSIKYEKLQGMFL